MKKRTIALLLCLLLLAAAGVGGWIYYRNTYLVIGEETYRRDITELDFSGGPAVTTAPVQGNNSAMANAALQELGYSASEIQMALKGVDPNATTEELVRHALRAMVMKG